MRLQVLSLFPKTNSQITQRSKDACSNTDFILVFIISVLAVIQFFAVLLAYSVQNEAFFNAKIITENIGKDQGQCLETLESSSPAWNVFCHQYLLSSPLWWVSYLSSVPVLAVSTVISFNIIFSYSAHNEHFSLHLLFI